MALALAVFVVSLGGIAALFAVKYMEVNRETVLFPNIRDGLDLRAGRAKEFLSAARTDLSKLPSFAAMLWRAIAREIALGFAAAARSAERLAHRFADSLTHTHNFETRMRSELLKKVGKRASDDGLDTPDNNGQNI